MYYYNNELPPQQGWICPKCGRVNAPWMPTCGCVSSQTSGTPYLVKTSSTSQDSHEIAKDEPTISKKEQVEELQIQCLTCGLNKKCETAFTAEARHCQNESRFGKDEQQTDRLVQTNVIEFPDTHQKVVFEREITEEDGCIKIGEWKYKGFEEE